MEKELPTAREFYDNHPSDDCVKMMIDFAKLHIEQALKEASEKATISYDYAGNTGSEYCTEYINKASILNSYPLDKIK